MHVIYNAYYCNRDSATRLIKDFNDTLALFSSQYQIIRNFVVQRLSATLISFTFFLPAVAPSHQERDRGEWPISATLVLLGPSHLGELASAAGSLTGVIDGRPGLAGNRGRS